MAPRERMKRSAAATNSAVLTPGRILPAIRSSVAAWMAPAAAIFSISSGDFLMITRGAYLPRAVARSGEGGRRIVVGGRLPRCPRALLATARPLGAAWRQ